MGKGDDGVVGDMGVWQTGRSIYYCYTKSQNYTE